MKKYTILGVKIDNIKKNEALGRVQNFLNSDEQHKIFTPNPEMLVVAHKDKKLKEILNSGSLNICDGKGIQFVHNLSLRGAKRSNPVVTGENIGIATSPDAPRNDRLERIPGIDFMLDICKLASEQGRSVYLLGAGETGGPELTAKKLKDKFTNLKIAGFHSGSNLTMKQLNNETILNLDKASNSELLQNIANASPDILFVAFGHKKQEYWIDAYLKKLPSVKIAMGVGGAFDFIAGNTKRAPKWMRNIGFEWLYRLIREPRRIGRIWNATIVFLYLHYIKKR